MSTHIDTVKTFWNEHPCQSDLSAAAERRQYFEEIRRKRYEGREWHVPEVARFGEFKGKSVVEIGCGIATDGMEFARRGANYTGVDLTPQGIEMARERFGLFGVRGQFVVANAEEGLPFETGSIDHVYSFGVIHHAPYPERIVKEIHRVLKPGGTFNVMLYNRTSINYYIEIMFLRRLFRLLLRPAFMPGFLAAITGLDRWKLEGHRKIMIERGKITKEEWISMNTDGPFCPLARVYNEREAGELFQGFRDVTQEVWEFNEEHWPILRKIMPVALSRRIGRWWGWHRIIRGVKG
jgi:ubiquinone/menaquinone biosynthesis C-methylase UbiE